MLSAETASGQYPLEAVAMMNRITEAVERDPSYRRILDAQRSEPRGDRTPMRSARPRPRSPTRLSAAADRAPIRPRAPPALRMARERPEVADPRASPRSSHTARSLALVWGAHCVVTADIKRFSEMVDKACRVALQRGVRQESASAW